MSPLCGFFGPNTPQKTKREANKQTTTINKL